MFASIPWALAAKVLFPATPQNQRGWGPPTCTVPASPGTARVPRTQCPGSCMGGNTAWDHLGPWEALEEESLVKRWGQSWDIDVAA